MLSHKNLIRHLSYFHSTPTVALFVWKWWSDEGGRSEKTYPEPSDYAIGGETQILQIFVHHSAEIVFHELSDVILRIKIA